MWYEASLSRNHLQLPAMLEVPLYIPWKAQPVVGASVSYFFVPSFERAMCALDYSYCLP